MKRLVMVLLTAIVVINGCDGAPTAPKADSLKQSPVSVHLQDVQHFFQVPPGDGESKNCGPTAVLMTINYLENNRVVQKPEDAPIEIVKETDWLADRFGEQFRNPNGYYTRESELGALIDGYWGRSWWGGGGRNLREIYEMLALGKPVIARVTLGLQTASDVQGHWVVIVGLKTNNLDNPTEEQGVVWLNDPGNKYGSHEAHSLSQFLKAWILKGKVCIFVQ